MRFRGHLWISAGILVALFAVIAEASAQSLVNATWVRDNVGKPGFVVLDIREEALFRVRHIPGAISLPYVADNWRVRPLAGANPRRTEQLFDARMSELGIANDSRVVLIHGGRTAADVAGAAFVFWHFKLLGHSSISIMNGGMVAYILEDAPLESVRRDPPTTDYKSQYRPEHIARLSDVEAGVAAGATFVDYRTSAYYLGISKIEEVARHGTIPNARNLPADWLTIDGGGMIRPREKLRKLYELRDIPIGQPHIVFSNASERAALGWFVASEIFGNSAVRLYESSLREWAANPQRPMQRQVNLD